MCLSVFAEHPRAAGQTLAEVVDHGGVQGGIPGWRVGQAGEDCYVGNSG